MDAPCQHNLSLYVEKLKKRGVHYLVRACEPSYDTKELTVAGVAVTDLALKDGETPTPDEVKRWLGFVDSVFNNQDTKEKKEEDTIAVHCVAGLGRAPFLVTLAFVDNGLDHFDAINLVRSKRRGALNSHQIRFIENYKSTKPHSSSSSKDCIIL